MEAITDPFGIEDAKHKQQQAQARAEEAARQEKERATQEQQRIEEKYGLTPGELDREQRMFELEKEREIALRGRVGRTGEQLLAEEGGPITTGLLNRVQQRLGKTGTDLFLEEGGLPARQYYERITAPTDEIFLSELELVKQMVNQEANRRGVFGGLPEGGIRFEQLGRAGVELAIKSARERMAQQSALASGLLSLEQNVRAEAGTVGERALDAKDQARAELDAFLRNQQGLSSQSRGRAANVALEAAGLADKGIGRSYDTTTDIFGQQFGQAAAREKAGLDLMGDLAAGALSVATGNPAPLMAKQQSSTESPKLLAGGSTSLRTRGYIDEDFLADEYTNIRRMPKSTTYVPLSLNS